MRTGDITLVGLYTLASAAAVMLIKQYASPTIEAWKLGSGVSEPLMFLGLGAALYGLSFLLWMLILSRVELSIAYPLAIGATLIATSLGSWLVLKEPLHAQRLAGMAVILAGIVMVTRS